MEKKQMYAAVAAIVIIVAVVAVAVWYMGNDSNNDTSGDDTYYFYLDGFNDEIDGWYSAEGSDVVSAFDAAMNEAAIAYNYNGWALTIEDYVGASDYDPETGISVGTGYGIFEYTSTDVSSYYSGYFFAGPALDDVTSNILYISYGEFSMDEKSSDYVVNPYDNKDADFTSGGPFATA